MKRALILLALVLAPATAQARHHHHVASRDPVTCMDRPIDCQMGQWDARSLSDPMGTEPLRDRNGGRRWVTHSLGGARAEILPHPAGCPRRAFCGCGASVKVFGRSIRSLWLAANWFKFPPAAPAPGMVAVRRHHVLVIEQVLEDGRVLAYDANSGGHLTRRHVRSLAGFSVRNPQGARYAALAT